MNRGISIKRWSASFAFGLTMAGAAGATEAPLKTPADFRAGSAIVHSGVRDQGNTGFCWAYATTGMLEAESLRERSTAVNLSEEYIGFYHIYEQLLAMSPRIFGMMKRSDPSQAVTRENQKAFTNDFLNGLIIYLFQHPQEGAPDLQTGISLIAKYGAVPESVFPFKSRGGIFSRTIQGRVRRFINHVMRDPERSKAYRKREADGTYSDQPIATALLEGLAKAYTNEDVIPPAAGKPSMAKALVGATRDGFEFEGIHYDPKQFAKKLLRFAETDYEQVSVTPENEAAGIDLLTRSLAKGDPVQLAFTVYDGYGDQAKTAGIFQPSLCDGKACAVAGGHAVLVVNTVTDAKTGKFSGVVVQNSWGPLGLDDRGGRIGAKGFQIITLDYLRKAYTETSERPQDRNWSILIQR